VAVLLAALTDCGAATGVAMAASTSQLPDLSAASLASPAQGAVDAIVP